VVFVRALCYPGGPESLVEVRGVEGSGGDKASVWGRIEAREGGECFLRV